MIDNARLRIVSAEECIEILTVLNSIILTARQTEVTRMTLLEIQNSEFSIQNSVMYPSKRGSP